MASYGLAAVLPANQMPRFKIRTEAEGDLEIANSWLMLVFVSLHYDRSERGREMIL